MYNLSTLIPSTFLILILLEVEYKNVNMVDLASSQNAVPVASGNKARSI